MTYNQRMNEKPQEKAGSGRPNLKQMLTSILLVGAIGMFGLNIAVLLRTNTPQPATPTAAQAAPAPAEVDLAALNAQPALGTNGPRINIVVDFECPYCNQFLDTPAYEAALAQAERGEATLSVTAAAFLNDRSVIKGSAYNCIAENAGAQTALALVPDLKTPGGDTEAWRAEALRLGEQVMDPTTLQTCLEDGQILQRAMTAIEQASVRGVPAVFVDGTSVPWTALGEHLNPTTTSSSN